MSQKPISNYQFDIDDEVISMLGSRFAQCIDVRSRKTPRKFNGHRDKAITWQERVQSMHRDRS